MKRIILSIIALCQLSLVFSQLESQSKIVHHSMYSNVLNADREYTIYLPQSYDVEPDREYPILYLLHGMTETDKTWFIKGDVGKVMDQLVASGEVVEMIIVSPNAGGDFNEGHWNGYFDMPGWNYETFFFTEFLPYIESTYRVIGDKSKRAIAGLSMGGGGATSYAQKHAELFSSVYAISALMSFPQFELEEDFNEPDDKLILFINSVKNNCCMQYVKEADEELMRQLCSVRWFVDCGDDDFLINGNLDFFRAMRKRHLYCEFRVRDGGHTWTYFHSALYTCLPFVSNGFKKWY